MLMKLGNISTPDFYKVLFPALLVLVLSLGATTGSGQAPSQGIVRPFAGAKFAPGDDIKCLSEVLENGDPATGPSTFLLKAPPKCVVPAHFHTAEEQLIVVSGEVSTGMDGMSDTSLGPGGFAMMPGNKPHWFSCVSKTDCLMFVTFDQKYDITWVKRK
jgi:quercetin dioxygenase-like cupin family protein